MEIKFLVASLESADSVWSIQQLKWFSHFYSCLFGPAEHKVLHESDPTINKTSENASLLSILPTEINALIMSEDEFSTAIQLRMGITIPNLPARCDDCGARFSTEHAVKCAKGGLITARHDEVKHELAHPWMIAQGQSAVRDKPCIQSVE